MIEQFVRGFSDTPNESIVSLTSQPHLFLPAWAGYHPGWQVKVSRAMS
jgi:hypothetical protein